MWGGVAGEKGDLVLIHWKYSGRLKFQVASRGIGGSQCLWRAVSGPSLQAASRLVGMVKSGCWGFGEQVPSCHHWLLAIHPCCLSWWAQGLVSSQGHESQGHIDMKGSPQALCCWWLSYTNCSCRLAVVSPWVSRGDCPEAGYRISLPLVPEHSEEGARGPGQGQPVTAAHPPVSPEFCCVLYPSLFMLFF